METHVLAPAGSHCVSGGGNSRQPKQQTALSRLCVSPFGPLTSVSTPTQQLSVISFVKPRVHGEIIPSLWSLLFRSPALRSWVEVKAVTLWCTSYDNNDTINHCTLWNPQMKKNLMLSSVWNLSWTAFSLVRRRQCWECKISLTLTNTLHQTSPVKLFFITL